MPAQPISIHGGKVRVKFPLGFEKFGVYEKEIPDELMQHPDYGKYEWVGSFGIKDDKGNNVPGRVKMPYEVQVEKVSGKDKLVYWDGSDIVQLTPSRPDFADGGRNYRAAGLDLGDPPVAWA